MQRLGIVLGLVLFLLGIIAVVHPTFQYGTREHTANFGPLVATIDEPKTFDVPTAATVALLVSGLALVGISIKGKS